MAKLHSFLITTLRDQMPKFFNKEKQKARLIKNLPSIIEDLQTKHKLTLLDLPEVNRMQDKLKTANFRKFPKLNEKLLNQVNKMLDNDISQLMNVLPNSDDELCVKGGVFKNTQDQNTPFGYQRCEGTDYGNGEPGWIVSKERPKWDKIFDSLNPHQDKITGAEAKREMVKSNLPNSSLAKIWKLSDIDEDGMLTRNEFALAMHLINIKLKGHEIPDVLPAHLYPPPTSNTGIIARV